MPLLYVLPAVRLAHFRIHSIVYGYYSTYYGAIYVSLTTMLRYRASILLLLPACPYTPSLK